MKKGLKYLSLMFALLLVLTGCNFKSSKSEKAAKELAASENHEFSIDIVKWG